MSLTNYEYRNRDSFPHAIAEGYKEAKKYWGIPGAASGIAQYAKHNYGKTATVIGVILAASLTTAYFLSPAYATFIGASVAKAVALVGPTISASAIAHPLVANLIVVVAVAALITATVLTYKNSGKSEEIRTLNDNIGTIAATVNNENKEPGTKIEELKAMPCLVNTRSA